MKEELKNLERDEEEEKRDDKKTIPTVHPYFEKNDLVHGEDGDNSYCYEINKICPETGEEYPTCLGCPWKVRYGCNHPSNKIDRLDALGYVGD